MERTHSLDALANALVEAARNLRAATAKLDSQRVNEAAQELDAAIAAITEDATADSHMDADARRAIGRIGVLAGEVAHNIENVNAILQKLGEDLLRAAQTLGQ
jgi:hypothetical protein